MHRIFLICAVVLAATGAGAGAGIRVVEDEVYFSLTAPGAKEVYLVGDFNNWNPTFEKMERRGNVFEISLYMIEGTYRYKFVVDGNWIVDPDNPGDPNRGSALVLIEKPAGLALLTEDPAEPAAVPPLAPWFRYIGQFRWNQPEDETFSDNHIASLGFDVKREKLRGRAVLQSDSKSWDELDDSFNVGMAYGYVGTDIGDLSLDAFEDDNVVWTSADPVTLIGNLGVFDYNAGHNRTGASGSYRLAEAISFRGLYADHNGSGAGQRPAVSGSALAAVASGADTTAYAFDPSVGDSDVFGFEVFVDAADYQAGIVTRLNRGLRPGTLAEVGFADSTALVSDTREDTDATMYWLRIKGIKKLLGIGASFGYGNGRGDIHLLTRERRPIGGAGEIETTQRAQPENQTLGFETSDRFVFGLGRASERWDLQADWDRVSFDFSEAVYRGTSATVDRVTVRFEWNAPEWFVGSRLQYTDQDYGDTPPELLIDSPERNVWLDWRDNFTVPNIVGIDTRSYTDLSVAVRWSTGEPPEDTRRLVYHGVRDLVWAPPAVRLELGAVTGGFFEAFVHGTARLTASYLWRERYFAMADGRLATYDKKEWGPSDTFVSGYLEVGYRYRWFDVNLGWGFDPFVYDRVIEDFNDIGRTEVLRRSIAGGVERGESKVVGERLLSLESQLQNDQTIKLEAIVRF
jgi:hypothetical protein